MLLVALLLVFRISRREENHFHMENYLFKKYSVNFIIPFRFFEEICKLNVPELSNSFAFYEMIHFFLPIIQVTMQKLINL